jgi:hypothetical protein
MASSTQRAGTKPEGIANVASAIVKGMAEAQARLAKIGG